MEKLIKNLTWMNLVNKLKVILTELSKGSGETNVSSDNITDATALGKELLKASNAASARTAIGAGTSNLTIGTTATTAKAGNYVPAWSEVTGKPATFTPTIGTTASTAKAGNYQPTAANISDASEIGRTVLTATNASAVRTAIGAGTSNLTLGSTASTAAAGNHSHTATQVTATAVGSGTATNVQGILVELEARIKALESA